MADERMQRCVAEGIGTFALVFAGTGAIVINQASGGGVTHVGIALTFGWVVMAMIYTLGDISGCHLNPAVTLSCVLAGRLENRWILPYILSQLTGAIAASVVLRVLFPSDEFLGATIPANGAWQSLILEFLLSWILMLVILRMSGGNPDVRIWSGAVIGSVIAMEAMFAGPICGASMNPARSIAPALVSGKLDALWVYVVGPILGMAASVPVERLLRTTKPKNPACQEAS